MTWTQARAWMPFLSGMAGGLGVIVGFVIALHSTGAIHDRDWQYFTVQFLCAAIIGIGGALILLAALEITK